MALYQFLILGLPKPEQAAAIEATLADCLSQFQLNRGRDYSVDQGIPPHFSEDDAAVAIFFGGPGAQFAEGPQLNRLGIPVVPMVSSVSEVATQLPNSLRHINALTLDPADLSLRRVANVALQCVGLLPAQRRVFISYRRAESADVALQLFEELSARQFDVFLDTHSVSAAEDFQSALWHRLCDSDVLLMLDTPEYFDSRWTTVEWGRAVSKHISVLQLVWPGHEPARTSRLATAVRLQSADFAGDRLVPAVVNSVAVELERVRSKSVALRHTNLVGTLRSAIEDLGGSVDGIGPRRTVLMTLPNKKQLVAYPVVGVPTSIDVHECFNLGDSHMTAVVYDHLGISTDWVNHMNWLAQRVGSIKWIRSREAGWHLAEITE